MVRSQLARNEALDRTAEERSQDGEMTPCRPANVDLRSVSVKIAAGPYIFMIDREVLAKTASGYLKAAIKEDWQFGPTAVVTLSDVEPDAVKGYLAWLKQEGAELPTRTVKTAHLELAQAYILADQLCDDNYSNAVIDAVIRTAVSTRPGYFPSPNVVDMVFDNVPNGGNLGTLYVKLYATFGTSKWANDDMHPQFLHGMSQELQKQLRILTRERGRYQKEVVQDRCQYHRHHAEALPGAEASKVLWNQGEEGCSKIEVNRRWWGAKKLIQGLPQSEVPQSEMPQSKVVAKSSEPLQPCGHEDDDSGEDDEAEEESEAD